MPIGSEKDLVLKVPKWSTNKTYHKAKQVEFILFPLMFSSAS